MSSTRSAALLCTACLALAGCADREVGYAGTSQSFGADVRQNYNVQAGNPDVGQLSLEFRKSAQDMINFGFNSAALTPQARRILDGQATWIVANPSVRLRIYGHTDLVGSAAYNNQLGLKRALVAAEYLAARGVDPVRLDAVVSLGKTRPLIQTPDPNLRNRRTVTEVVGVGPPTGPDFDGKRANAVYTGYASGTSESEPSETLGDVILVR